jgi:hypothetical protein
VIDLIRSIFGVTDDNVQKLSHFEKAEMDEIPQGWHRLLAAFSHELDIFDAAEDSVTTILKVWIEDHRLLVFGRTTLSNDVKIMGLNRLCDSLETDSRSTCEKCGKSAHAKMRRVGNTDTFAVLCLRCQRAK